MCRSGFPFISAFAPCTIASLLWDCSFSSQFLFKKKKKAFSPFYLPVAIKWAQELVVRLQRGFSWYLPMEWGSKPHFFPRHRWDLSPITCSAVPRPHYDLFGYWPPAGGGPGCCCRCCPDTGAPAGKDFRQLYSCWPPLVWWECVCSDNPRALRHEMIPLAPSASERCLAWPDQLRRGRVVIGA